MRTKKIDEENVPKGRANKVHVNRVHSNKSHTDAPSASRRTSYKDGDILSREERQYSSKNSSARPYIKKKPLDPIRKIEWPEHLCERCGELITDLTQALSDKNTGKPVHFECILALLKSSEELKEKEEVVYIGNGNFAVVYFENPKIRSKFKIVKLIEWEDRNKMYEWQDEIAKLGSST